MRLVTKRNQKVRITIHLDEGLVSHFRNRRLESAKGYQALINGGLRKYAGLGRGPSGVFAGLVDRVKRLEEAVSKGSSG